jgi:magnesium chelatase family protein
VDRLDLHVHVPRVDFKSLREPNGGGEISAQVAARVRQARELQIRRQGACNAHLNNAAVERYCTPDAPCLGVLERAVQHYGLSARGYHRVLKVARTIADMTGRPQIDTRHLTEALTLRPLDRHPAR